MAAESYLVKKEDWYDLQLKLNMLAERLDQAEQRITELEEQLRARA